jgi:predicted N-acetyltransferase YhbS
VCVCVCVCVRGYIAMLAVDKVLRGKGIGSCLVRFVLVN